MKKILFVCRGNIFRSRLAEAYFNKLRPDSYIASSSGVEASRFGAKYASEPARKLAKKYQLELSLSPIQTTQETLDSADVIVFVKDDVYKEAKNMFKINESKVVVWDVYDIYEYPMFMLPNIRRERSWQAIKNGVEELIQSLESVNASKEQ